MQSIELSKKQRTRTLSKKRTPKKTVRNVLSNPITQTCVTIDQNSCELISMELKNIFKCPVTSKIKWSDIKNVPKSERKMFRETVRPKNKRQKELEYLIFGINSVTRAIENNTASIVMIAPDADPALLVKHIWQACDAKCIPVVYTPTLRSITNDCFGFTSIVVALKCQDENNPLFRVCNIIKNITKNFTPINLINVDEDVIEDVIDVDMKEKETTTVMTKPYLHRNSKEKRVFTPNRSTNNKQSGFISFGVNDSDTSVINLNESSHAAYMPPQIKRVIPNPKRKRFK